MVKLIIITKTRNKEHLRKKHLQKNTCDFVTTIFTGVEIVKNLRKD